MRESDCPLNRLEIMEIFVIGSGTGAPSLRRGAPGTIIRFGGNTLLLDNGSGTLQKMLQASLLLLQKSEQQQKDIPWSFSLNPAFLNQEH